MKNKKAFRYSLNSKAFIVGAIVIVLLLNAILVSLNDKISLELDFTKGQVFALTEESKAIVDRVGTPMEIMMLTTGTDSESLTMIKNVLEQYTQRNSNITVREVNYIKNPSEIQAYLQDISASGMKSSLGSLIIKYNNRHELVDAADYFSQDGFSYVERCVTTKIATLVDGMEPSAITFVVGHGERRSESAIQVLESAGYEIKQLDTLTEEFPEDSDSVVIINIPGEDFSVEEIEKLDAYLSRGGNVQIYFDPAYVGKRLENLESYLESDWGIIRNGDVVVDSEHMIANSNFMEAVISDHEIVAPVAGSQKRVGYSFANSLTTVPELPVSVEIAPLLSTNGSAYAKADMNAIKGGNLQKAAGDKTGKFDILLAAGRQNSTTNNELSVGKLIVGGSVQMFDALTRDTRFANEDLLLNIISWMKGGEASITVRAKELPGGQMVISIPQFWTWFVILVVVIPLLVLAAGIVIFVKRRYK